MTLSPCDTYISIIIHTILHIRMYNINVIVDTMWVLCVVAALQPACGHTQGDGSVAVVDETQQFIKRIQIPGLSMSPFSLFCGPFLSSREVNYKSHQLVNTEILC